MGKLDKERRAYPKEFKAEEVAPAQKHEKPVRQVTADLGINCDNQDNIRHLLKKMICFINKERNMANQEKAVVGEKR
jgi:hypothetical protein